MELNMFDRTILGLLTDWKNKTNRKPLILRGARQELIAQNMYDNKKTTFWSRENNNHQNYCWINQRFRRRLQIQRFYDARK